MTFFPGMVCKGIFMGYLGPIYSMSDSRKEMFFLLRENSDERILHLLLMAYFRDNPAYNHWRGESFGFIPHRLSTFKGSHRYPKIDFIEQNLYLHCIDSDGFVKLIRGLVNKKGLVLPSDFQDSYWKKILLVGRILHEVSIILARDHAIEDYEYYDILSRNSL
jgi:hypothetical protein